jgi:hypothetical protein
MYASLVPQLVERDLSGWFEEILSPGIKFELN